MIDELHNVLAGNSVNRREFLNLLRFLGNELRIPLVGVGTREAYLAIRSEDQLENRFEPMMLPLWEANDDCCSLLASFAASLPLRRHSLIATPDMARYPADPVPAYLAQGRVASRWNETACPFLLGVDQAGVISENGK